MLFRPEGSSTCLCLRCVWSTCHHSSTHIPIDMSTARTAGLLMSCATVAPLDELHVPVHVIKVSQLIQSSHGRTYFLKPSRSSSELRGSCGPHRSRHSKFDYRIDYPDTHLPPPLLIPLLAFFGLVLRASLRLKKGSAIILPSR